MGRLKWLVGIVGVAAACASDADMGTLDAGPFLAPDAGAVQSSDAGSLDSGMRDAALGPSDASLPISTSDAAVQPADATPAGDDAGQPDASAPEPQPASAFHGVNWADARDNYVDGLLQLSGLDTNTDSYQTVRDKAQKIAAEFRSKLGANAIRIPINEPTVAGAWWDAYKAVIDASTADGMMVVVAYWAHHNGKPDSEAAFKTMWQKVVTAYAENPRVYFDIHNEPYGFAAAWNDEAARWLGYFPELPRGRVVVAGTGYDEDVKPVGADARFDGCLLQLHFYAFWHADWTTQKQWRDALNGAVGPYAERTFVGEWGNTMTGGIDYNAQVRDGSNAISYVTTMTDFMHTNGMGGCYWPGLRDGDTYSMTRRGTGANASTLSIVNPSGLDRVHWGWGI